MCPPGKCPLAPSVYGLRQSGRVWYQKLRDALLELGFKPSAADPCVFIRSHDDNLSIIFTHVDDLGIICNSVSVVAQLTLGAEGVIPGR